MSVSTSVTTTLVGAEAIDALIARYALIPALIEKYANLIANEARRLVHVDTGALKASITITLEAMAAEITAGEGLTYAAAVEFGDAHSTAYPYMRPASERYFPGFLAELQALIGG